MSIAVMAEPAEKTVRAKEAAQILEHLTGERWPARRLYRCVERGYLPARRIGWSVRFLRSELEQWWEKERGTCPEILEREKVQRKAARRILGARRPH
jgi:excisionase family DNA binding protein